MTLIQATKNTCELLEGSWGLVIIDKNDINSLICCRFGSPLLIGFGEEELFISSEIIGF